MPFRVRSAEWKKDGKSELTIHWRDLDGTQKHLKVVVDVRVEGDIPSEAERERNRRAIEHEERLIAMSDEEYEQYLIEYGRLMQERKRRQLREVQP